MWFTTQMRNLLLVLFATSAIGGAAYAQQGGGASGPGGNAPDRAGGYDAPGGAPDARGGKGAPGSPKGGEYRRPGGAQGYGGDAGRKGDDEEDADKDKKGNQAGPRAGGSSQPPAQNQRFSPGD